MVFYQYFTLILVNYVPAKESIVFIYTPYKLRVSYLLYNDLCKEGQNNDVSDLRFYTEVF